MITVEGKVSEPFGQLVPSWLKDASDGKTRRLNYLCNVLNLESKRVMNTRYQLSHRATSAIIEAKRFNAKYAIMLVHSFSQTHEGFEDFQNFTTLYCCAAERGNIHHLKHINGVKLFTGWITGNKKYLSK